MGQDTNNILERNRFYCSYAITPIKSVHQSEAGTPKGHQSNKKMDDDHKRGFGIPRLDCF